MADKMGAEVGKTLSISAPSFQNIKKSEEDSQVLVAIILSYHRILLVDKPSRELSYAKIEI